MSDLKLFNIKSASVITKNTIDLMNIKKLIEKLSQQLLGVTLIATDFEINSSNNEYVDFLGYDENNQIVIIEYRSGKYSPVISKSLLYIDYLVRNPSHLKVVLNKELGYELSSSIYLAPRLISIGDDYNQYDEYAIKQTPYMIDLIKYQSFNSQFLVFEKTYQSKKIDALGSKVQQKKTLLGNLLSNFILSLGDEVCEVVTDNVYSYRKISNFAAVVDYEEELKIHISLRDKSKTITIKNQKALEKAKNDIENAYNLN